MLNALGGTETFLYQLAKKYGKYDLVIIYEKADPVQLCRLKKYVKCVKYEGQVIKCKKAFFNYGTNIIDNVEAEEYIQIIHADYKANNIIPNLHPKITKYIGVSQLACNSFKEITGKDIELCYNPISVGEIKKPLLLISATRLNKEKGSERMEILANELDEKRIPYLWLVFTKTDMKSRNKNIIFMDPKLDITNYIAKADYLVQLSDNEGYCYSVVESLLVGTPVIVTNCPVFQELGINDREHGFILDFDMKNIPVDEIYTGLPKFTYKAKKDNWNKYIVKKENPYLKELAIKKDLIVVSPYYSAEYSRDMQVGEKIYKISQPRANDLLNAGVCKELK